MISKEDIFSKYNEMRSTLEDMVLLYAKEKGTIEFNVDGIEENTLYSSQSFVPVKMEGETIHSYIVEKFSNSIDKTDIYEFSFYELTFGELNYLIDCLEFEK